MVKVAINLYLLVGVSFANAMDNYCRELGFRFAPLADCLRNDERIGRKAYLSPSLGISGGHLERDLSTILSRCGDTGTRALFAQLKAVNDVRMNLLFAAVRDVESARRVRRVLWLGASYKAQSFSLVNSPLLKFARRYGSTLEIEVHDSLYAVPPLAGTRVVPELAPALAHADLVVLNYARPDDLPMVRDRALTGAVPVLDISLPDAFGGSAPAGVRRIV
jgi:UDPglucose 6-dehydrogenase